MPVGTQGIQAFDRYAAMMNNPPNLTDPSGHCVEGSDDFDECVEWAEKLENDFDYVDVVICLEGDIVDGCVGWTAEEMMLLYETLSEYIFEDYIDDRVFSIIRSESDEFVGLFDPNTYELFIFDEAWKTTPSLGLLDGLEGLFSSSENFQGVIAHELTHVAQNNHPWMTDVFIKEKSGLSKLESFVFEKSLGTNYDFGYYDEYKDQPDLWSRLINNEYMAMMISSLMYSFK